MKTLESRPKNWMAWLALLAVFAITGCPASTTVKTAESAIPKTLTTARVDLLADYNRIAARITTLNLSVDLVPSAGQAYSGFIQQYHAVNGFILAKRPGEVRMIGQVLSKNIFDMTSDGETFHIFIPSKNKFIVGSATLERPAEKPIENIRPQHLLDALFWPQVSATAPVVMAEDDELTARYYVLSVLSAGSSPEIERNLWFDRANLNLVRIQIYADEGKLVSDIRLEDWEPTVPPPAADSLAFPRHITMQRPHDDYKLEIKVKKVTLNESISDDRFQLLQPAGTELVKVGEAGTGNLL